MIANIVIQLGSWDTLKYQLKPIRTTVFIQEQHVPAALEWDDDDPIAMHFLLLDNQNQALGCARVIITPETNIAHIGRMAILAPYRKVGLGRQLLKAAIDYSLQQNVQTIALSAQTHATKFYEKAQFKICSEPYLDAGILHVDMVYNRM